MALWDASGRTVGEKAVHHYLHGDKNLRKKSLIPHPMSMCTRAPGTL